MVPVCPACRAQVALDAYSCDRCGLAIRPTCGRCGEPLQVGALRCRSCFETITAAAVVTAGVAEREPSAVGVRHVAPPLPPAFPRRRRTFGRVVMMGVLAGLIVTVGLLVVDTEARRWRWPAATDVALVEHEAPRQNVTFRAPHRWELDKLSEEIYLVTDDRRGRDRTMLVQSGKTPFSSIPKRLPQLNGGRYLDYRPLATARTRVDEHDALRHSFIGDDLERLQIWIERGKGVLRVEFTYHPSEGDDAVELARRVMATFEIS